MSQSTRLERLEQRLGAKDREPKPCRLCRNGAGTCLCAIDLIDFVPSRRFLYAWWAALGDTPGPGLWAKVDAHKPRPRMLDWAFGVLDELRPVLAPEAKPGELDDEGLPVGLALLLEAVSEAWGRRERWEHWNATIALYGGSPRGEWVDVPEGTGVGDTATAGADGRGHP
jgi:hypothetical protein